MSGTTIPTSSAFTIPATPSDYTSTDFETEIQQFLEGVRQMPGAQATTELTISSGTITPSTALATVDTEGNAGSDNLDKIAITNMSPGNVVILRPENVSRIVRIRDNQGGAGNINLARGDYFMHWADACIVLVLIGSEWYEITRNEHVDVRFSQVEFTSSTTWVVPRHVTKIWITAAGGGGGGGEGGEKTGGVNGNDGAAGVATSVVGASTYALASGGSAGIGGKSTGEGGQHPTTGGTGHSCSKTIPGHGERQQKSGYNGYGAGGKGGNGETATGADNGGGGGSGGEPGEYIHQQLVTVVPNETLTITIGTGGAGGTGGSGIDGAAGVDGAVLIEY